MWGPEGGLGQPEWSGLGMSLDKRQRIWKLWVWRVEKGLKEVTYRVCFVYVGVDGIEYKDSWGKGICHNYLML